MTELGKIEFDDENETIFITTDQGNKINISILQPPDETKQSEIRSCENCGNPQRFNEKYKKCSRCKKVYYCSNDCHKKHWKIHKYECSN